ncbi:hypothetical protein Tco_0943973 [Tanacetum coccineum]
MDDCGIIVNQLKILLRVRILFLQESGMKVAFLRDKIHLLATFLSESEATPDIQSYTESKCEIERVEREIPKLKERLKTLKETAKKCTKVLDSLRRKVEPYENIFKEAAATPW